MKVIHVLRKPCSEGTVAANVLRWGTGAMNIDAARIGTEDNLNGGAYAEHGADRHDGTENWRYRRDGSAGVYQPPMGRWPANLILQHLDGCRQVGMQSSTFGGGAKASSGFVNGYEGDGFVAKTTTVPVWACEPGCPVAALDAQSGVSKSTTGKQTHKRAETTSWKERGGTFTPGREWVEEGFGDTGGASRYFKQVKP